MAVLDSLDGRRCTLAIMAGAAILRVLWALAVPAIPVSDQVAYLTFATNLAQHGVYGWTPDAPSAYWPVGTSAIYAALLLVLGLSSAPASIVVLNIVLGTAIVGLTMYLARIFFGGATALLAGAIMAVWPSEVAYVTITASELPFTFLVLLGFAAWFGPGVPDRLRPLACGLACAAAGYVRPLALLLPVVLWISATPDWRQMRRQLPRAILAMVVMAALVAPWSIRNTLVFGHFVVMSTNGGTTLWMGNNPETNGFYMPLPPSISGLNEYERNKALGAQAMSYIVAEPVAFVLRTLKKAALLHMGETIAVHWNAEGLERRYGESVLFPLKLITQGFWTAALLLALAGLGVMAVELGILATLFHPIVLTWGYYTAFYAVTLVQDRYHFPSHPFMSMLMAMALLAAFQRVRDRKTELPA